MKRLLIVTSIILFIFQSLFSQEKQVLIPSNALDRNSDAVKYCNFLSKKENLDRKTIYNLAKNGIIARSIQNSKLEYTQVRYNHMLLKLFSDSYFTCQDFSEHYYLVFDAENSENIELVAQHKLFSKKLLEYIESDNNIQRFTNSESLIFGYLDHIGNFNYSLSFYHFLPDNGPVVPNEINNRFAKYNFRIDGHSIVLVDKEVDEREIENLPLKKSKVPPPPPMPKKN